MAHRERRERCDGCGAAWSVRELPPTRCFAPPHERPSLALTPQVGGMKTKPGDHHIDPTKKRRLKAPLQKPKSATEITRLRRRLFPARGQNLVLWHQHPDRRTRSPPSARCHR